MRAAESCDGDLRKLLGLADALDAVETLDEFPRRSVELLRDLLPADSCSYTEINPLLGRVAGILLPEDVLAAEDWAVFNAFSHEHPVIAYHQCHEDGRSLTISDFLSQRRFRETGLYREFYRRADTEYQLACRLSAPRPLVIGLVFNRQSRDFDGHERRLIDQARPHLLRAYRRLELTERVRALQVLLDERATPDGPGTMLISGSGVIMACSERAAELCQHRLDCLPRPGEPLPSTLLAWLAEVWSTRAQEARTTLFLSSGRRKSLCLELLPSNGRTGNAYLLRLREHASDKASERLVRLGLTPRQAETLALLARGLSNKTIARQLGIAPATVKKHLDQVYGRLEVDNRTAAVAMARRSLGLSDIG